VGAYSSAVLADSPLHYWRAADPGGVLLHDVGSQQVALMMNNVYPTGLPYSGPNADGASFVGQAIAYPWFNQDSDAFAGGALSLELWVWQHSDIAAQQLALIYRISGNAFFIQITSGVKPAGTGTAAAITSATNLTRQRWHHIVFTVSAAGAGTLYVDAISVATGAVGIPPAGSARIGFGGNVGTSNAPFQGAISEGAIYASVLSPTRVTAHFTAADNVSSKPVFAGNGVFNTGSGTSSLDSANIQDILSAVRKTFPTT